MVKFCNVFEIILFGVYVIFFSVFRICFVLIFDLLLF